MGIEIERKFLVLSDEWKNHIKRSFEIKQGYFSTTDGSAIRSRISDNGSYITIKLPKNGLNECPEYEYHIPQNEAEELIAWCHPKVISKIRNEVEWEGRIWEVDVFNGKYDGLVIAEIELTNPTENVPRPHWCGKEVTDDIQYTNKYMAQHIWGS